MKLTVTQIILGLFVAAACVYILRFVRTTIPWLEDAAGGGIIVVMVNAGAAMVAAHWMAILTAALGLGVCATGLIYLRKTCGSPPDGLRTLVVAGIILGAAVVLTSILINAWGFPTSMTRVLPDGGMVTMFWMPSHSVVVAQRLAGLVSLSGLIILGCGIAGYLKIRRRNSPGLMEEGLQHENTL